jgi:hypothetical protein
MEERINPKKPSQRQRNIPLYRRANSENMKDDLNKLHEDIIKMKNQKSNVNAMWTHFQIIQYVSKLFMIGYTFCVLFDYVL